MLNYCNLSQFTSDKLTISCLIIATFLAAEFFGEFKIEND